MVADEAGIVTVGKDSDGHGYVLADLSGRYFPGHRHLNPPSALADKFGVLWRSMPANSGLVEEQAWAIGDLRIRPNRS